MLPTIVIIGRRNVGKSALFNRLIEQEKAIVSGVPGTTRDRTEGVCLWRGKKILIVDTGGLDVGERDTIDREVKKQARFAIKKADLILFLVDARVGPQPADRALAKELHKDSGKTPVFLVANKAEAAKWQKQAQDPKWKTFQLGLPITISALTGQGVGDLLDETFVKIKKSSSDPASIKPDLKVAIIGKPNVGKSSLLNKILGEERVIVSPIAHTTREPQDTLLNFQDKNILLIDTAGIRRKARISKGIEKAGVTKTLSTIKKSDLVILVLDTTENIDTQDKHLAGMVEEVGVGVIIVANKWDLLKKAGMQERDTLLKSINRSLPGITYAPVVFISALTGHNVHKLLSTALEIHENRQRKITKKQLAEILPKLILRHKPARGKGSKHPIIRRIEQTAVQPPAFTVIMGPKQSLHQSYLRYLENRLREFYNFEGTPIKVLTKQEMKRAAK